MSDAYAKWSGRAVVLQVQAAEGRVPLRGMIVGENNDALRFRVGLAWDIDIFKSMIVGVEEGCCTILS